MKLTEAQTDLIIDYLHNRLILLIEDYVTRDYFIINIIDLIIKDIEECADWSNLNDDEIEFNDIDITLARILCRNVSNFK